MYHGLEPLAHLRVGVVANTIGRIGTGPRLCSIEITPGYSELEEAILF